MNGKLNIHYSLYFYLKKNEEHLFSPFLESLLIKIINHGKILFYWGKYIPMQYFILFKPSKVISKYKYEYFYILLKLATISPSHTQIL